MFALRSPCVTCPFRIGQGSLFMLPPERLDEIVDAVAFQCHKTVDYDQYDHPDYRQGETPAQCAGLMSVLHRANRLNQIMQVASRLGALDLDALDPRGEAYASLADVYAAHEGKEPK